MSNNLRPKKISRAVSAFFLEILDSYDKPVYYDRLRGYVSSSPTEIKAYVKKHCHGEDLLTFFKRRSVIFNVTRDNCVEIKQKDKRKKAIFDDEDTKGTKPSSESNQIKQPQKKPSKTSGSFPSPTNSANSINKNIQGSFSAANDNPWNWKSSSKESIWEQQSAIDVAQLEEETLEHFKQCFHSKALTYVQLNYYTLPRNVRSYLKLKYTKDKVQRFLLDHCDVFSMDDDGYVTIIDVPEDDAKLKSIENFNEVFEDDFDGKEKKSSTVNSHSIDILSESEKLKTVSKSVENCKGECLTDVNVKGAEYFSKQLTVSDNKKGSKLKPKKCSKADMVIAKSNEYSQNQQFMNPEKYESSGHQETTGTSRETSILGSGNNFITMSSRKSKTNADNKNSSSSETAQNLNKNSKECYKSQHKNNDSSLGDHGEVHQPQTNYQYPVIDDAHDLELVKEFYAIQYFVKLMEDRKNSPILIERIRGHLTQAPREAFNYIKARFKGNRFKTFFTSYPKIFYVCRKEVQLANSYALQLKKMRECTIPHILNNLISSHLPASLDALHSGIEINKPGEGEIVMNATFLLQNLSAAKSISIKNKILTRREISSYSPKSIFCVEMSELQYLKHAEIFESVKNASLAVSFARSEIFNCLQSISKKKKLIKLYNLPILNELNRLKCAAFGINEGIISNIPEYMEVNAELLSTESNQSNNQGKCGDPTNLHVNNISQSKANYVKALKSEKIVANCTYSENPQSKSFLDISEEEEKEAQTEHTTNKLLNNAEGNITSENSISKTDHLLNEDSIIKHGAESKCSTINSNDVSKPESNFMVKVCNEALQENIDEDNEFYHNNDIRIETSNHIDGSFGKWIKNNEDGLSENVEPAIPTPNSHCSTDVKGTEIIATIYDRDYEIVEQEQVLENFPTYFCRFICLYVVQELKNDTFNGTEGNNEHNGLKSSQMSNGSAGECNVTSSFSCRGSHDIRGRESDSEERMTSLLYSEKDNKDEVLQEEKSFENAPLFKIHNGLLKSLANNENRNGCYTCDLKTIDTLKFPSHEDNTTIPRDVVKENNSFVSKDRIEKDVTVLKDVAKENISTLNDLVEEGVAILKDPIKDDTIISKDADEENSITSPGSVKQEDITLFEDLVKENVTASKYVIKEYAIISKDSFEQDAIISKDPFEDDATILKELFEEDAVISKVLSEQDAIISKDPFEEDAVITKDPFEQDVIISKNLFEEDAIISKDPFEEDAVIPKDPFEEDAVITKDPFEQDVIISKNLFEEDAVISKDPFEEDAVIPKDPFEDDAVIPKDPSKQDVTTLKSSAEEDTTLSKDPVEGNVTVPKNLIDEDDTVLKDRIEEDITVPKDVIEEDITTSNSLLQEDDKNEAMKKYLSLVNTDNKNSGKLPAYSITISAKDFLKGDVRDRFRISRTKIYKKNNASNFDRNKIGISGFCSNASEVKVDRQPLNSTCSSSEFAESDFASALSMTSQEKMEICSSDTMISSLAHEKPLNTQLSGTDDVTNSLSNSREETRKSTFPPFQIEGASCPANTSASLSNDYVMVFYGYVILLTKDVCIAKSIENGLPIFCSRDFFKCHKHKTGVDACFNALTISDIVCCHVLTPSPETNIMTCCQFSNTDDVEEKTDSFIYRNPNEMKSIAVQTQCNPNADALVEVKESSCQTISTGEILLTKCLFPNA